MIHAALDHGVNFIDACCQPEVETYAEALGNRRKDIYFGCDWTLARKPEIVGSAKRLIEGLDEALLVDGSGLR